METEWVLGIAAGTIAAVSGMKMANSRTKSKKQERKEQVIMDEFITPFLPEVMGFYHLEVLGKDPLSAVDRGKLVDKIYRQSLGDEYGGLDRHGALGHLQELAEPAKNNRQELLQFLFWYLDFSNGILKDMLEQSNPLLREARLLEKQFAVWFICHEELKVDAPDSVLELIHHSSYFAGALKEIEAGVFREMMADDELRGERRGNFSRIIFQAFEKEAEGEAELKAVEQFREHYNKRYTHRNKGQIRF
ncbi:hypothetical protein [Planococcus maitriensis]|uniref:Uncharacterized protein n=1 Tax=Planococcus maitriensis TaxID=221799 RepID=A0A365KB83_9BACL|nr:hypothetical protein [Planococcus maitriensis]RAZ70063.1 hypothetical protein DP119_05205 [Planococcus maitriensis]